MRGITILGSGRHVPGTPVASDHLGRVMDTNGEWIAQRTGIERRHFARDGEGATDLAVPAALAAIEDAGLAPGDIDYVVFNTMTPDYVFPGSGVLLAAKLGLHGVPALDLRQQCAALPFSLQVVNGLVQTGAASRVLIACAEAHAGFMPWRDWSLLAGEAEGVAAPEDFAAATEHRGVSILFGDGAGALVVGEGPEGSGWLGARVHSDGRRHDALRIEAGGFRRRPYLTPESVQAGEHLPRMNGRELFRAAVQRLPEAVRELLDAHGLSVDDVDWFLAHQANERINQAVRESLGVPASKVPSNIADYGNTSSATIPILVDELRRAGKLRPGELLCFMALGAGLNWGAALMRA